MPEQLKTKQVVAPIIKSDDLPDDVKKAGMGKDIDKWFYATVEAPDREKDIVRVAGIDLKSYSQNGPLKFISSHKRGPGPDGRLPVVGKAVEWVRTKHKATGSPALAVGIKFAPTELGKEMKALYDGDFLTDVSIGFEPLEAEPIKDGGYDYKASAIGELSACITGMNQFAGVLRALEAEPLTVQQPDNIWKAAEFTGLQAQITTLTDTLKSLTQELQKRLDDIEGAIEAAAQKNAGSTAAELPAKPKKIDPRKLADLLASL